MAQTITGKCTFTNGSATVQGNADVGWNSLNFPDPTSRKVTIKPRNTNAVYQVASVNYATRQCTLTALYAGATVTDGDYEVSWDFTSRGYRRIGLNDQDFAVYVTEAIDQINEEVEAFIQPSVGPAGEKGDRGLPGNAVVYAAEATYAVDDQVYVGEDVYYSLQDNNIGHAPASSPTWWQKVQMGRPAIDALDSVSTTDPLSANQGRILAQRVASELSHIHSSGVQRQNFYFPQGVTMNSCGGYAFAKWREADGYIDAWSISLERVAYGLRRAAELGITTITEWAVPGNIWTDYAVSYGNAGNFETNGYQNDALNDWSCVDLTIELARKYGIKILWRVPNNMLTNAIVSPTKYSKADYLNKYLKPVWGAFVTRYQNDLDVMLGIDWGFELDGRYAAGATTFSDSLTPRTGYGLADEWVDHHIALRNYLRITLAINIAVCLGATNDWTTDGDKNIAKLLHQMNAKWIADGSVGTNYAQQWDEYALLDYYGKWDNPVGFKVNNNDPFDPTSFYGDTTWLPNGTWDAITANATDAFATYGLTGRKLGAPEGGFAPVMQDVYNLSVGSTVGGVTTSTVTVSLGNHNFLKNTFLSVGEKVLIGDDGILYTVATLGGGSPAGSSMTVTSTVVPQNMTNVRVYCPEREERDYLSNLWVAKKMNQYIETSSGVWEKPWEFFNRFLFWDNSTSTALDFPNYTSPGASVYAQYGQGLVKADTLEETYLTAIQQPEPYQNAKTIVGRAIILTDPAEGEVLKFDESGNIVNGADTGGTGSLPASLTADETNETLTQTSTVESNAGNPISSFAVEGVFNGGPGAIATFENTYAGSAGAPMLFRRSRNGGAVINGDFGGSLRYQYHDGSAYFTGVDIGSRIIDTTTGAATVTFNNQDIANTKGQSRPAIAIDEKQNVQLGRDSSISSTNTGGGARGNLILTNAWVVAPTAGVTDAVAVYASDLNGAGTTGLIIRTEDNKTFSLGTKANGTGYHFPDGTVLKTGALNNYATTYHTSATLTLSDSHHHVMFNYAGAMTVTFPAPSSTLLGREYVLRSLVAQSFNVTTVANTSTDFAQSGVAGTKAGYEAFTSASNRKWICMQTGASQYSWVEST